MEEKNLRVILEGRGLVVLHVSLLHIKNLHDESFLKIMNLPNFFLNSFLGNCSN